MPACGDRLKWPEYVAFAPESQAMSRAARSSAFGDAADAPVSPVAGDSCLFGRVEARAFSRVRGGQIIWEGMESAGKTAAGGLR
jgi:hypothetical protein